MTSMTIGPWWNRLKLIVYIPTTKSKKMKTNDRELNQEILFLMGSKHDYTVYFGLRQLHNFSYLLRVMKATRMTFKNSIDRIIYMYIKIYRDVYMYLCFVIYNVRVFLIWMDKNSSNQIQFALHFHVYQFWFDNEPSVRLHGK